MTSIWNLVIFKVHFKIVENVINLGVKATTTDHRDILSVPVPVSTLITVKAIKALKLLLANFYFS